MTEKEKWLADCHAIMENIASVQRRGFDPEKIAQGMMNGNHLKTVFLDPVTQVLKMTDAWYMIDHMPERVTEGEGHSTRHYWPKDVVIDLCMKKLSELYDKVGGIPQYNNTKADRIKYNKTTKVKELRIMNVTVPRDLYVDFNNACKTLGISKRSVIEPLVVGVIQAAKEVGIIN